MTRTTLSLLLIIASAPAVFAQAHQELFRPKAPDDNPVTQAKAELGRYLFESPLLSRNRMIACSTCHDPQDGFADDMQESRGIFETEVGRNSPTLWGIAMHPGFLGELPKAGKRRDGKPVQAKKLSLEQRCLTPIANPVEMGNSVKQAVRTLKKVPGMRHRFDDAFGKRGHGVSGERIGKAIATYLRTLEVPASPYRSFLAGNEDTLGDSELRGLQIFAGRGKCASCHSGEYMSDGRFHVVQNTIDFRARHQQRRARRRNPDLVERRAEERRRERRRNRNPLTPEKAGKGQSIKDVVTNTEQPGGYDGLRIQVLGAQTPTLWDVARTAPYFRDGSVNELETCVRQHIAELQRSNRSAMGGCDPVTGVSPPTAQLPRRLRPTYSDPQEQPKPQQLSDDEVTDLLAFLGSLSAPGRRP